MKVVRILIPSLHGLGVRQKFLGVYKPAFLESRSLKASLSINHFSYFHMLFSHSAVPNFPIRSTIPRKLPGTWQNAVFEKQPFYIKLNLQKFSSTNYILLVVISTVISIPCFKKVQYFYSFFIHHMFFPNSDLMIIIIIITYFSRMNI